LTTSMIYCRNSSQSWCNCSLVSVLRSAGELMVVNSGPGVMSIYNKFSIDKNTSLNRELIDAVHFNRTKNYARCSTYSTAGKIPCILFTILLLCSAGNLVIRPYIQNK